MRDNGGYQDGKVPLGEKLSRIPSSGIASLSRRIIYDGAMHSTNGPSASHTGSVQFDNSMEALPFQRQKSTE
jgi:hypothetical protein